jgi:hypothetical protein
MQKFTHEVGTYKELNGLEVENIATALEEPLAISVEWYDRDSKEYIDLLYEITVQITVYFSISIIFYYMFVIRLVMTKLGKTMCEELCFRMILPKSLEEVNSAIEEAAAEDSVDTTKEQLYSS